MPMKYHSQNLGCLKEVDSSQKACKISTTLIDEEDTMSIFDNTFVEAGWECVQATKNITRTDEYKYVNLNLMYELGTRQVEVGATYAINVGGQISREVPVKMLIKMYELSGSGEEPEVIFRRSLRAFRPDEMTEEMIKDIKIADMMFDDANKDIKRVFL